MKPILTVSLQDKQAESTINTLFEDVYNRLLPSDALTKTLRAGKIERPLIISITGRTEYPYAIIEAACTAVEGALFYIWGIRIYGTQRWTEFIISTNEQKFIALSFKTTYEVRVRAVGTLFVMSDWSPISVATTVDLPKPSVVTGITVTNQSLYVDPTTGVTLARVRVEWNNNPASEFVDTYEVLWTE